MTERLEEIQKEVNYAYRRDGSISTKAVTMPIEHYEHLYEQAERVRELEGRKYRQVLIDEHIERLEQQNQRYKQALERVLDFYPGVPNAEYIPIEMLFEIRNIARKALEREG